MPIVKRSSRSAFDSNNAANTRPDSTRFQTAQGATPGAFGANVFAAEAASGQAIANAGEHLGNIALQEQRADNDRTVKSQFLEYEDEVRKITDPFYSSEGRNTLDTRVDTEKAIQELGRRYRSKNSDNREVAQALDLTIKGTENDLKSKFDLHVRNQQDVVDKNNFDSLMELTKTEAVEGYTNDIAIDQAVQRAAIFAGDYAKQKGLDVETTVKAEKAKIYEAPVKAALSDGNDARAQQLFYKNILEIPGERRIALRNFMKDQVSNSIARTISDSAFRSVQHLPIEEQERAANALIDKTPDYTQWSKAKGLLDARFEKERSFRAQVVDKQAEEELNGILKGNDPFSPDYNSKEARDDIQELADTNKRKVALARLEQLEAEAKKFKKSSVENHVGNLYTLNPDAKDVKSAIEKDYKDDPAGKKIALDYLEAIFKNDKFLETSDLSQIALKHRDRIIKEVDKDLGDGVLNSEKLKAATIKAEKITDPIEQTEVLKQINSHFSALAGIDRENQANEVENKAASLADSVSGEEGVEAKLAALRKKTGVRAAIKKRAAEMIKEVSNAAKADRKASLDEAKGSLNEFLETGKGSIEDWQKSNQEAYKLLSTDAHALNTAKGIYLRKLEGKDFPIRSEPSVIKDFTDIKNSGNTEAIANYDIRKLEGSLTRKDLARANKDIQGAKDKLSRTNEKYINSIFTLTNRLQPRNKKNKPLLHPDTVRSIELEIHSQVREQVDAGKNIDDVALKQFVISAFSAVKSDPENTGLLGIPEDGEESIGGERSDTAIQTMKNMSPKQLRDMRVEIDFMHPSLRVQAEKFFRSKNPGVEPSDADLEKTAAGLVKAYIKRKGVK